MSTCKYCQSFTDSTRKLAGTGEEKSGPSKKLCPTTKAWKNPCDDYCDEFTTTSSFWCDKHQCFMGIDACRSKKLKKLSRHCKHCSQYLEVLDAIRLRRKDLMPTETAEIKPMMRRRTNGPE